MMVMKAPNQNLWSEATIATASSECNSCPFLSDGWKSEEDQECLASRKGHLSEGHQFVAVINEEIKSQRHRDG